MNWTQQRKEQTWGEEEACRGNTEARMEKTNSARETRPKRKLLPHETYREWAEAEDTLEKTFTEDLPKYQRSQTSS